MIVDANVFKGYYQFDIGVAHTLCACPGALFSLATANTPIYYDDGNIIESEWKALVDRDWFEPWLASQLTSGAIAYMTPIKDAGLEKNLATLGFPSGRDIVYVRVGLGVAKALKSACKFFTEDLDFYAPKQKKSPAITRNKILRASNGPVQKLLRKRDIEVGCTP